MKIITTTFLAVFLLLTTTTFATTVSTAPTELFLTALDSQPISYIFSSASPTSPYNRLSTIPDNYTTICGLASTYKMTPIVINNRVCK